MFKRSRDVFNHIVEHSQTIGICFRTFVVRVLDDGDFLLSGLVKDMADDVVGFEMIANMLMR